MFIFCACVGSRAERVRSFLSRLGWAEGVGVYGLISGRSEMTCASFTSWVYWFDWWLGQVFFSHCFVLILGLLGVVCLGSWVQFLCFSFASFLSVHVFCGLGVG